MNKLNKKSLEKVLIEKINRMSAERNPKDSKYPLTITAEIVPVSLNNFDRSHPNYNDYVSIFKNRRLHYLLPKTVKFQGDYASKGNTGVKTLRLKITREDWPDQWVFPTNELDRRLFLQNFRLSNLSAVTPFDQGGNEYENLFPVEVDEIQTVEFEDESGAQDVEVEDASDEESSSEEEETDLEKILRGMEYIDFLMDEARETNELEIAAELFDIYKTLATEAIKLKREG